MGIGVGSRGVVKVIGGKERDTQVLGELHQIREDTFLNTQAVVHDFDKIVVFAKDVSKLCCGSNRFVVVPQSQMGLHFT